jgi:hypothetical protein
MIEFAFHDIDWPTIFHSEAIYTWSVMELFVMSSARLSIISLWKYRFVNYECLNSNSLKSNIKIVERGKIDVLNTQIHDRTFSWLGTGTSVESCGVQLLLSVQTSTQKRIISICYNYVDRNWLSNFLVWNFNYECLNSNSLCLKVEALINYKT